MKEAIQNITNRKILKKKTPKEKFVFYFYNPLDTKDTFTFHSDKVTKFRLCPFPSNWLHLEVYHQETGWTDFATFDPYISRWCIVGVPGRLQFECLEITD